MTEKLKEVVKETKVEAPEKKAPAKAGKLAAVLIRSTINVNPKQKNTLYMLRLRKKHACVVVEDTLPNRGMLTKVKDWVAWGVVSEDVAKELQKQGKVSHLHPPRGGYERKGIKVPYGKGGALGFRGEKMTDLIKRML